MISQQGISMSVHAGAGMAEIECFQYESFTRGQEVIRAEHHASICLRLHVTSAFEWYGADVLLLQVRFGTAEALLPRRIFKPANGEELEIDLENWKVWNRETYEWREAELQFCDLEYVEGMGAPWSEARRSNFGTITVTVQRMAHGDKDVKYQWPPVTFEPTTKVCSSDPLPPGTAHTIESSNSSRVERVKNFEWGSVTRLEGNVGNCFTFRFLYRSERWLKTLSKEPLYPSNYLTAGIDAAQTALIDHDGTGGYTTEALGRGLRRKSRAKNRDNYIVKTKLSTKNNEVQATQQSVKIATNRVKHHPMPA